MWRVSSDSWKCILEQFADELRSFQFQDIIETR